MTADFSTRLGLSSPKPLQVDTMDDDLRNAIWNFVTVDICSDEYSLQVVQVKFIARHFFKRPVDIVDETSGSWPQWFRTQYFALPWNRVYDLLEFVVVNAEQLPYARVKQARALDVAARILETERSGYRFSRNGLIPIASAEEVGAIEAALDATSRIGLPGVYDQLAAAIKQLGVRPQPQYPNVAKDAVLAVESLVNLIVDRKVSGVDVALKELEAHGIVIHPALRNVIRSLYAYASTTGGVRHGMSEESVPVGLDEAKFVLVSCSAVITFLIAKARLAGLLKNSTSH